LCALLRRHRDPGFSRYGTIINKIQYIHISKSLSSAATSGLGTLLAASHRCKKADLMTADGAEADRDHHRELLKMGRPSERYGSDCKKSDKKLKSTEEKMPAV
jgi:hypothetical protein